MKKFKSVLLYFSIGELMLWICSMLAIFISFMLFDKGNYITLVASLIGVTALIFNAKGNPIGQFLILIFSLVYGYISFHFAYYGEMVTYIGMTFPMAFIALIAWLKNPFEGKKSQVEISILSKKDIKSMIFFAIIVTVAFFFILNFFDTKNLLLSTFSVTTSFVAVFLTFKRSPYYAMAYALNDVVLIFLWVYASFSNTQYICVAVCFFAFLFNDVYAFINWKKLHKKQIKIKKENEQKQ